MDGRVPEPQPVPGEFGFRVGLEDGHYFDGEDGAPGVTATAWTAWTASVEDGRIAVCRTRWEAASRLQAYIAEAGKALDMLRKMGVYRGEQPLHEAPPTALIARCPLGLCDWDELWDTPEEVRAALLGHVEGFHGEPDPIGAIVQAHIQAHIRDRDSRRF